MTIAIPILNIVGRSDSRLQLFYKKFNIGKHTHDWFLKLFGLIVFEVVEKFLQYWVYYPLPHLEAYGTKLFPHFL